MRVIAGKYQRLLLGNQISRVTQGVALRFHQLLAAGFTQLQQGVEFIAGEGAAFAGALQFNKFAAFVHDKVHVGIGAAVLDIAQIQARRVFHYARADGGDLMDDGGFLKLAFLDQAIDGAGERDKAARDGCRARTAVGFQHVAVDGDGTLAQTVAIHCLTQRAADQAADLHAAAILLDAVALLAAAGGGGQHGVFSGQPAAVFIA